MKLRTWQRVLAVLPLIVLLAAAGCAHKGRVAPAPPPTPAHMMTGACCAADGGCTLTTQANCTGTWHSDWASCDPNPCPKPGEGGTKPEVTEEMVLTDVFFDFDRYNLRDTDKQNLNGDAKMLMDNAGVKALLEGHCDERGTVEYNLALGERRAKVVKDYLVKYGIDVGRLSTISYGEERPFSMGHDESAWSQNRRVHFVKQ